jgi:hypothetical protein
MFSLLDSNQVCIEELIAKGPGRCAGKREELKNTGYFHREGGSF